MGGPKFKATCRKVWKSLKIKPYINHKTLETKVSFYLELWSTRRNCPMICLQQNPCCTVSLLKYLHEQNTLIVLSAKGASASLPPQRILCLYIRAARNSPSIHFALLSTFGDFTSSLCS